MEKNKYQYIHLFAKAGDANPIGWFCIYPAPKGSKYRSIQHWAFVNPADAKLEKVKFIGKPIASFDKNREDAPKNREEWLREIEKSNLKFGAFIHRKCFYNMKNVGGFLEKFEMKGESYYNINLQNDNGIKKDWLVLKTNPRDIGVVSNYYQVSLLKTLENNDGTCISGEIEFTESKFLETQLPLDVFFKGIDRDLSRDPFPEELKINLPEKIEYALLEEVTRVMLPPDEFTVPKD